MGTDNFWNLRLLFFYLKKVGSIPFEAIVVNALNSYYYCNIKAKGYTTERYKKILCPIQLKIDNV